jgi:hypothetical protein
VEENCEKYYTHTNLTVVLTDYEALKRILRANNKESVSKESLRILPVLTELE